MGLPVPEKIREQGDRVERAKHFTQWMDDNSTSLMSLTTLGLDGKGLALLPPEIGRLQALRELDLSKNQLTSLPPEIKNCPVLKNLYLGENPLTNHSPEMGA